MNQLLFSIVIPVYNVEGYLSQCVESVEKQKFGSCELILVDDGSTDSSGKICDQLAKVNENVRVFHQKNAGLSAARNTGIRNSQGEYIVLLDSDDELYDDSLKNLAKVIEEKKYPDFVISRRCTIRDGKMIPCAYQFTEVMMAEKDLVRIYDNVQKLPDCWLGAWIFSIKRSYCLAKGLFFYDGILHEDEEWVPRVFFNAATMGFNNNILYCNRVEREGSITATPNIKREFDKLKIIDLLTEEFQKQQYSDTIRLSVKYRTQQLLFGILCETSLYKNNSKYRELLQAISAHKRSLMHARRTIYHISYLCLCILGAGITCSLLGNIDSWRRK